MTENQIIHQPAFFFSSGKFWQTSKIFINIILIYCKIKEEAEGKEEASEEVTFSFVSHSRPSICT